MNFLNSLFRVGKKDYENHENNANLLFDQKLIRKHHKS